MHKSKFSDIEPFDWKELNGKFLEIKVKEETSEGMKTTVVMGRMANTDTFYILVVEHEKVTP